MNQWCRIKLMDQSRLNRRIYQWSVNHGNFRSKNWTYRIKQLMDDCNTGDLFTTGSENINKSFILNRISEYLKTQDNQTCIRKTCPCNEYPLKPHFYIVKLGYAGVDLFFLFLLQNIDCGYSLEPPRQGGSNVYPQSMF